MSRLKALGSTSGATPEMLVLANEDVVSVRFMPRAYTFELGLDEKAEGRTATVYLTPAECLWLAMRLTHHAQRVASRLENTK